MRNIKKRSFVLPVLTVIILLFVSAFFYGQKNKKQKDVILFFSEGCSHCQNVEEYLAAHREIEEKIEMQKREINKDQTGAMELERKARSCNLDISKGIPVPFLFFKGECIMGEEKVIDYLKEKT